EIYIRLLARFAKHFGCSPDRLGPEHVRRYQLLLPENKTSWSLFNQTVGALRFFYRVTLKKSWRLEQLPYGKRPKRLPCVLSQHEVLQLLEWWPAAFIPSILRPVAQRRQGDERGARERGGEVHDRSGLLDRHDGVVVGLERGRVDLVPRQEHVA